MGIKNSLVGGLLFFACISYSAWAAEENIMAGGTLGRSSESRDGVPSAIYDFERSAPSQGSGLEEGYSRGHGGGHVHSPSPVHGGYYPWLRWQHPVFTRPIFNFDWARVRQITCTATDSKGIEYPVTQDGYLGFTYAERMDEIQDAALDRCYQESSGDKSCSLANCTAGF